MELNKCVRCGSFYISKDDVCPNCLEKDNNEIHNLKNSNKWNLWNKFLHQVQNVKILLML